MGGVRGTSDSVIGDASRGKTPSSGCQLRDVWEVPGWLTIGFVLEECVGPQHIAVERVGMIVDRR